MSFGKRVQTLLAICFVIALVYVIAYYAFEYFLCGGA